MIKLPASARRHLRRQKGLVTRRQLLDAGVPSGTVNARVRRGQLIPVERGVYRIPDAPRPPEQAVMAAVLRCGDGARATGPAACALFGLEGFPLAGTPVVAVPVDRSVEVGFVVYRTEIPRCDRAVVAGVPAVKPIRAVIDAAIHVDSRTLRVAIDDARRRRLVDLEQLLDRAVDLGRHRGAAKVRHLFDSGTMDQDGELERKLALALAEVDLKPAWGVEVLPSVTVDASFAEASYALECDGAQWHTIESDRAADVSREGILRSDGWHVDRISDDDLTRDPDGLVRRIAATRASRMEQGLGRPPGWAPVHPGRRLRPPA